MKTTRITALAAISVIALTIGFSTPAAAATYTGTQICGGAYWSRLTIDARGPGAGWEANAKNLEQDIGIGFPGGHSVFTGYYQSIRWSVSANAGFYWAPVDTCTS